MVVCQPDDTANIVDLDRVTEVLAARVFPLCENARKARLDTMGRNAYIPPLASPSLRSIPLSIPSTRRLARRPILQTKPISSEILRRITRSLTVCAPCSNGVFMRLNRRQRKNRSQAGWIALVAIGAVRS